MNAPVELAVVSIWRGHLATRTTRSLKHEYALFIEQEIENYKESIPRSALLAIGDEAATRLMAEAQFTLTEMLLCEEVDRLISRRLRLPKYDAWRKKRLKLHQEMRRPEHWGLTANDALVRSMRRHADAGGHVLVAGEASGRSALFLAASGCEVTALEADEESVQRVMEAAVRAGLSDRLHPVPSALAQWTPEGLLHGVVCSHAALKALPVAERARVIAILQTATRDGGVHLVETIAAGTKAIDELRAEYRGWKVSVEQGSGDAQVFLARKDQSAPNVSH